MYKSIKVQIYPNRYQKSLIKKTLGCVRYVFNSFLSSWDASYKSTGKGLSYQTCSKELTALKRELLWLREVDSQSLQISLKFLSDAFSNFFKKKSNYPKFKSKKNQVNSYTTNVYANYKDPDILFSGGCITLPKIGRVKARGIRKIKGRALRATVSLTSSGKFYVSVLFETETEDFTKTGKATGVDLGIKDFAILSDGTVYKNPRFLKALEKKLVREQRKLSRRRELAAKQKRKLLDSKNYQKQRIKVARIFEKIRNQRNDYLHKVSTEIIKNHDLIGIENLKVSNLVKNRKLAKAISQISWFDFRTMLEYKAKWYGKEVVVVASNFPSSQLCSSCGFKNKATKDLKVRAWICPNCGDQHDRDVNAAKNLETEAERILASKPSV